jgi:epoxyqueuosine reductase
MTSNSDPSLAKRSQRIKIEAQRLGFELVGISPARVPPHEESFARWLREKYHGRLDYMERTELLRRDPRLLVPWAVSIISLGMNYHTPFQRLTPPEPGRGWISRYAWGADYHEIIRNKLEALLTFVREIGGETVEGRAFVDTAPILERDFAGTAGIGWTGKNTQLISPKKGSWFSLVNCLPVCLWLMIRPFVTAAVDVTCV